MDSLKRQEASKKWAEEYRERVEKRIKEKKNIVSSDSYILWLENFTLSVGGSFCDDEWSYFPERIREEDKEQLGKLHLFYEIISEYAEKQYIYPNSNCGESYFILHNNMTFEIGYMTGQGTSFFCSRVELLDKARTKNCIKFEDIKCDRKRADISLIENKLSALAEFIHSIAKIVPIEAIESLTTDTINSIKEEKSKEKAVVLIKEK